MAVAQSCVRRAAGRAAGGGAGSSRTVWKCPVRELQGDQEVVRAEVRVERDREVVLVSSRMEMRCSSRQQSCRGTSAAAEDLL